MSRFEEVVNEAIDEVVLSEAFKAETLAAHIAELVRDRQDGCAPRSRSPRATPSTSSRPRPARARRRSTRCSARRWRQRRGTRRLVGVEAQGMTACPCAQELVMDRSQERLARGRLHRRRDRARLRGRAGGHPQPARHRHAPHRLPRGLRRTPSRPPTLLEIVESSMSSEIYELMKRSDEVEVVEKRAHAPALRRGLRPRDGAQGHRASSPRWASTPSSPPARRTSRRSTSTTSSPSATGCSASSPARSARATAPRAT